MRQLISTALSIGLAASLCACQTPAQDVTAAEAFVAQVQADAQALCGVAPDALSVAALLSGNSLFSDASAMASAICGAVVGSNTTGARMVRRNVKGVMRMVHAPVTVNGVLVHFID